MATPPNQAAAPPPRPNSNELLRLVFDHAGEGISVFDAQMRLVAWNERFLSSTGLTPSRTQPGTPLLDLLRAMAEAGEFGPCDAQDEAARRLALLRDGPASVTQRRRPNGRMLELRRNPTPDGGFVMLYADITERLGAEAALDDKQRMLALLLERTEQGFWFVDNEQRTTDANPAMCRMLGLPHAQLLGRSVYEFVDDANAEVLRQHVQRRTQGQAESYEITLTRTDGRHLHCHNNATPLYDVLGHKRGAVGMLSDISERKHAEDQARESSALLAQQTQVLEATLQSLSQGVLSIDAQGRINAWNRRALELLELSEEVMRSHNTLPALGRYQTEHGLVEVSAVSGLDRPPLYDRTRRDGTVLRVRTHVSADGSVVRTYTDITAAVQAQRALAESETRFRTMADAAPALIWLAAPDGSGIWFNQRWLHYTGRSMAEEVACNWPDRMHTDDLERCRGVFQEAAARQAPFETEYRVRRPQGDDRWVVDSGIPRLAADGSFEGYIVYGWDITERRAAEADLRAAKEEAERANRAKSDFLSRMSHELRTPLNAVLGFAQLLQSDADHPLKPTQRARVHELMRGGRHLLSLINEVLDLARIEAGTLQLQLGTVDLVSLIDESLPLVQPMADERGIGLQVLRPAPGSCPVQADATRLKQVLLNLLSNAVKYNRPDGRVELCWTGEPAHDSVLIEVRDTGPGLSAAQQARLFQAFERLDAERTEVEGAGIGLALSKWLVDLMGGDIGVHSVPGQGSTFWVRLRCAQPRQAGAAEAAAAPASSGDPRPGLATAPTPAATPASRHTVLYIEDNPVNQMLMEGMLAQRPGLRLLVAGLPETGLLMAAQAHPDLVLLDIQLPGIDGYEVLRRLRAHEATQHIPVVAVSANAMQSDLDDARRAGFADYVTKPLDLRRLLAVVDSQLDPAQPAHQPAPT